MAVSLLSSRVEGRSVAFESLSPNHHKASTLASLAFTRVAEVVSLSSNRVPPLAAARSFSQLILFSISSRISDSFRSCDQMGLRQFRAGTSNSKTCCRLRLKDATSIATSIPRSADVGAQLREPHRTTTHSRNQENCTQRTAIGPLTFKPAFLP